VTFFAVTVIVFLAFGVVLLVFTALCIVAAAADREPPCEEGNPLCLVVDLDGHRDRRRDGAA